MFELEATSYEVEKGKPVTVKIKRVGGSKGTATVRFITEPGTGVHGKVYQDTTQDVTFEDGETEKTVTIPTIDFTEQADSIFDFKAKLTSVSDGALLGFATDATIQVMKAELLIRIKQVMMTKLVSWITVLAGTMKPIQQTSTKKRSLGLPLVA